MNVTTVAELSSAVESLSSNTTIVISPGTYVLTGPLYIRGPLSDVALRGATDHRDDVILRGAGANNTTIGYGIWVGGEVQRLTIANLTVRDVYYHPIIMNFGPNAPRIYNVHLINGGEQLLKTNPGADNVSGINDGIVEYSVFEYAPNSKNWYANAIQVLGGKNWIIRNNLIRNIRAPQGELAGPAVLAWFAAGGTIVEGNTFINCQREISFGLIDRTPNDHSGGVIRNNFIFRDSTVAGDVAIGVFDSPNTKVLHNTVFTSNGYPNAIEYRFANATGILVENNLVDGAITAREGATATVRSNYTGATLGLFIDAPAGDMHLKSTAMVAIDKGIVSADVNADWDEMPRPFGAAPDLGADEYSPRSGEIPSPPANVNVVPIH